MNRFMMAAVLSLASLGAVQANELRQVQTVALTQQAAQSRPVAQDGETGNGGFLPSDGSFIKQQSAQYNQDPGE